MAPRIKTGGRQKGSKNRDIKAKFKSSLPRQAAETLAQLDRTGGKSMAQIQIEGARYIEGLAATERAKPQPQEDLAVKYTSIASKIAHDVSPYLYPALQSIKHGGDENAAPIRMESLSEYQLEILIGRLRKG